MKTGLGDPQGDSVFTGRWKFDSKIGAQILLIKIFLINSFLTAFLL
jgi:hypothetical protein